MFSYSEKDSHKMPQPTRAHFPLKFEFDAKEEDLKKRAPGVGRISDDNDPREDEVFLKKIMAIIIFIGTS